MTLDDLALELGDNAEVPILRQVLFGDQLILPAYGAPLPRDPAARLKRLTGLIARARWTEWFAESFRRGAVTAIVRTHATRRSRLSYYRWRLQYRENAGGPVPSTRRR